jgi:endogenous inhibitor of DNA gyrase (YacG/DUF329 family)
MPDQTFECPSCGLDVEGDPETCPYCGYEFPERSKGVGMVAWLMAALMLIPLIWVLSRLF